MNQVGNKLGVASLLAVICMLWASRASGQRKATERPDGATPVVRSFRVTEDRVEVVEESPTGGRVVGALHLDSASATPVRLDSILYVARRAGGVAMIDIGDPAHPREISTLAEGVPLTSLSLAGKRLRLQLSEGGTLVYDLSAPLSPRPIGGLSSPSAGIGAQAGSAGPPSELRAALGDRGLEVFARLGGTEERVAELALAGERTDLVRRGDTVYVAQAAQGIAVIDISDFRHPRLVGRADLGYVIGLSSLGARLVAKMASGALLLLDISDPHKPRLPDRPEGRNAGTAPRIAAGAPVPQRNDDEAPKARSKPAPPGRSKLIIGAIVLPVSILPLAGAALLLRDAAGSPSYSDPGCIAICLGGGSFNLKAVYYGVAVPIMIIGVAVAFTGTGLLIAGASARQP